MRCLTVLYDARCGLCRWARSWLERQETWIRLEFIAVDSPVAERRYARLLARRQVDELLVISDEGGVYRDGNAWIMCLHATADYREWAERLSSPALLPLARQGFALLSKQRGRISRWLGLASETEIAAALAQVVAPACDLIQPVGLTVPPRSNLSEAIERDEKLGVPDPVGIQPPRVVGNEDRGTAGDPVDNPHPLGTGVLKGDPVAEPERVDLGG